MIDQAQIAAFFSVPELSEGQKTAYSEIVETARAFAEKINENMPDGEDKAQVINALRQNLLTVELAIRYRYKSPICIAKGVN
jgi:hypothetical protein